MITFRCDQCGHAFSVADELAGRRGRCKQCQAALVVPAASAAPQASAARPTARPSAGLPAVQAAPAPIQVLPARRYGDALADEPWALQPEALPSPAVQVQPAGPQFASPTIIVNITNDNQLSAMSFADSYSSSRATAKAKARASAGASTNGASSLSVLLGLVSIGLAVAGYDTPAALVAGLGVLCAIGGALWGLVTWRGGVLQALIGFVLCLVGAGIAAQHDLGKFTPRTQGSRNLRNRAPLLARWDGPMPWLNWGATP